MKKIKNLLEAQLKKAPVQLGAGFDEDYLYIQTTCQPEYDHLDVQVELYQKKNPTISDVLAAQYILELLAKGYDIEVSWNHLDSAKIQTV